MLHCRGQFAVVRKCVDQKSGAEYAAKIMRKRRVARGVAAADIGTVVSQNPWINVCKHIHALFSFSLIITFYSKRGRAASSVETS